MLIFNIHMLIDIHDISARIGLKGDVCKWDVINRLFIFCCCRGCSFRLSADDQLPELIITTSPWSCQLVVCHRWRATNQLTWSPSIPFNPVQSRSIPFNPVNQTPGCRTQSIHCKSGYALQGCTTQFSTVKMCWWGYATEEPDDRLPNPI